MSKCTICGKVSPNYKMKSYFRKVHTIKSYMKIGYERRVCEKCKKQVIKGYNYELKNE